MKTPKKPILILLILTIITSTTYQLGYSQNIQPTRDAIQTAYQNILEANNSGGNVTDLINQLNQAIDLLNQAEKIQNTDPSQTQQLITQAQTIAINVIEQSPAIKQQGITQNQTNTTTIIILATTSLVIAILAYLMGPKIIWRIWLRQRRNNNVKVINQKQTKESTPITAKQIFALILGTIIIITLIGLASTFIPQNTEKFSELGILGPTKQLENYPKEIVAGETINLYGYVANQMDEPTYYTFLIKYGDNTTATNPAPLDTIQKYEKIIQQNQTWTFPIELSLTQTGQDQRIIFELWTYNVTTNQNQYTDLWLQLWVNVNPPA